MLARIRVASIAQKKELDATLEGCQQMQKKVDVAEAKTQNILNQVREKFNEKIKADMPNMLKKVFTEATRKAMAGHSLLEAEASAHVEEPTEVGDPPRLASHAGYPAKRSRPSPSASSGASSGAAGGAAGGAASVPGTDIV